MVSGAYWRPPISQTGPPIHYGDGIEDTAPSPEVRDQIEAWLAADPDPETRTELAGLLADDPPAAAARFRGRVAFGTAGLRAPMMAGPTGMNRLVVRQTTVGLMRWLGEGATVVIGHDARRRSATFAADVGAMVAAMGGRALMLPGPQPTPVLAFAVLDREADAGVMITASHNPPADNGYKLYLADGIQLVDPADAEIAAEIDRVADQWSSLAPALDQAPTGSVVELGPEAADRHRTAAVAACRTSHRQVRVLYTAMHGVGGHHVLTAFEAAGFPRPQVVEAQFAPDPDFPTVSFPNPEEPGAMDLALAQAAAGGVDLVLANDPDADRLAVAVPDRSGTWTCLSGDQVGVLLADHLLTHSSGPDRILASSVVSSQLISAMAVDAGLVDVRTLTGFKWLARPIVDCPQHEFLLGYEEALGYCVGDRVRDKDGVSAALVMAELVAEALAAGETLWDRLDRLALRHGLHLTAPVTLVFPGPGGLSQREYTYQRLRAEPPKSLAGVVVRCGLDLTNGDDLPPAAGLVWNLADRSRVVVRPSGTEPKLKAYLEVIEPVVGHHDGDGLARAVEAATARLDALREAVAATLAPEPVAP